jgi:hypothetical protein
MTQSLKQVFVVWLGLYGLAHAQPQSRSELIDSARADKEANLRPETTPKAERRLEGVEHLALPHANGRHGRFQCRVCRHSARLGPHCRTAIHAHRLVGRQACCQGGSPRGRQPIIRGPAGSRLAASVQRLGISEFQRQSQGHLRNALLWQRAAIPGKPGEAITGWKIRTSSCVPEYASTRA